MDVSVTISADRRAPKILKVRWDAKKKEERMDTGVFNQKAAHLISRGSRSESWKQDVQKYLSVPGSEQFA